MLSRALKLTSTSLLASLMLGALLLGVVSYLSFVEYIGEPKVLVFVENKKDLEVIRNMEGIKSIEFISSEEVWGAFRKNFPELSKRVWKVLGNPMPDVVEVEIVNPDILKKAGFRIEVVGKLSAARKYLPWVSATLLLCALFTTFLAVRLSVLRDKKELEVVRTMGGSWTFAVLPYAIQGILIGAIGAGLCALASFALSLKHYLYFLGPILGFVGGALASWSKEER